MLIKIDQAASSDQVAFDEAKLISQVTVDELTSPFTSQSSQYLIQSPYIESAHLLDLATLDQENALLARALTKLRNTRSDYATAPYSASFNWPKVIAELRRLITESDATFRETSFYVVAFRSQMRPSTDDRHLGSLDKAAHAEAVGSGGFLKYWFGAPDSDLRNLATCIWRSREDAVAGGRGPAHREAASSTRSLYMEWKIEQHRLTVGINAESWEISVW